MTQPVDRQRRDVLASAAAGDEYAFRRIIADHHEDMRRVCRAIAGDDAVAEEAVEAAWVVAWKKLGQVRGPEQLRPWLVSVAANEVRHLLRKRRGGPLLAPGWSDTPQQRQRLLTEGE